MSVAFDAVGPNSSGFTSNPISTSPKTFSHTCSGADRVLFVEVGVGTAAPTTDTAVVVSGVTYNGVAMTFIGRRHSNDSNTGYAELWVLVNPDTGANTVSVTFSSLDGTDAVCEIGSVSFTGVDQVTPYDGYTDSVGTGTSTSITVTSKTGDMVLGSVVAGGTLASPTQTSRWLANINTASAGGNGGQSTAPGAPSVDVGYAIPGGDFWVMLGVNVRASTPALRRRRSWAPLRRRHR